MFIDGINDVIYFDILGGNMKMHKRKPLPSDEPPLTDPRKRSIIAEKAVDVDQHKKMIRRFMRLNKKFQKTR